MISTGSVTIGIDCGYRTGGVALISEGWAEVHDLPVYSEGGVDVRALLDIIESVDNVRHIYIEAQQAMPRQGVVSVFKLGYGGDQACGLEEINEPTERQGRCKAHGAAMVPRFIL